MNVVIGRYVGDPGYDRIQEQFGKVRRKHNVTFWGLQRYSPFRGCPTEDHEAEQPANAPKDSKGDSLSEQACSAYRNFEQVLSSNSASDLEEIFAAAKALPEDKRLKGFAELGVSQSSIDFLQSMDGKEAMGTVFILVALMNKHHPDLLKRFMETGETNLDPALNALGGRMLDGFLNMALGGYQQQCLK